MATSLKVAPGICKRCRHTERYAGPILDGICGNCADDLQDDYLAAQYADWNEADRQQREFDVRQEEVENGHFVAI